MGRPCRSGDFSLVQLFIEMLSTFHRTPHPWPRGAAFQWDTKWNLLLSQNHCVPFILRWSTAEILHTTAWTRWSCARRSSPKTGLLLSSYVGPLPPNLIERLSTFCFCTCLSSAKTICVLGIEEFIKSQSFRNHVGRYTFPKSFFKRPN